MVDSRDKGTRAETIVRDILKDYTKLKWERVPGSGALNEKHQLKGDLYVPGEKNLYCTEVKHYAIDHFNSTLFTGKSPQLIEWWSQAIRQGEQVDKKPLLLFKHDRSKIFAAYIDMPDYNYRYVWVNILGHQFYVSTLTDWITFEKPRFIL
jgi:hypothetical protein